MNVIKRLIELSPCVVQFTSVMHYYGEFCHPDEAENHIKVYSGAKEYEQIAVLAHEIGHALCEEKKCKCRKSLPGDHAPTEYHAMKFGLNWLLKHRHKESLMWEVDNLEKWSVFCQCSPDHQKAARKVMKLKLWKKCKKFIEEEDNEK